MKQRYCRVCGGWHQLDRWPHNCMPERIMSASDLPSPHFISDSIEIQSMHDGQIYTSKSRLRSEYKAHGVIEIGNEKQPALTPYKADRKAIRAELRKTYSEYNS